LSENFSTTKFDGKLLEQLLLETIPDVEMTGRKRAPVAGEIPNPIDPPSG
jgi:hypothetical protein